MAFATGAQASIAYEIESAWGTQNATPALTTFPVTDFNLRNVKDTFESKVIRSDRQTDDLRHGFAQPVLDFGFELKHGNLDAFLAAAFFGSWSSNIILGGTTVSPMTIESKFGDITQHFKGLGMMVNTLSLKVSAEGIVTGKCGMIGKSYTLSATSADAAGGYTAHTAGKKSMSCQQATVSEGGSASSIITSIDLSIDNGLDPAKIVGSASAAGVFPGRQKVSGTVSAFFETSTLLNKFLNETSSSIVLVFTDPDAATLTLTLPAIKYTGGEAPVDGESGMQIKLPFQAIYDATTTSSIKLERSA